MKDEHLELMLNILVWLSVVLMVIAIPAAIINSLPEKPKHYDQRIYDKCVLESTNVTNDLDTYCKSYTRQYLRYNGEE